MFAFILDVIGSSFRRIYLELLIQHCDIRVCRGFFLLSRDPLIWRSICHKLWDARQIYQEVANGREDKKRRRQRRRQSFRKQDRSLVNSTEKFPAKAIVWRRLQPSEETPVGPLTLVLPSCELGGGHAVTILPPPTTPSASEFQGPTRCGYDSWFQLAMQQPRILFDGCYLSRVEYTRSTNCAEMGLERLLVVRYFRALRFLSSRRILFVNSPFSAIHIVNVLTNLARHLQSSVTCLPPTIFEMGQTEATDLRTMVLTEAESGESCNDDPTAGNSRQRQSRVDLKDSIMIGSYTFIGFDRVCFYVALCAALFTLYWLILVISLPMFWSLYRSVR
ncbi:unnamed protein product [Protopolystoma xenopodis]|uniref:F-box protein Hrt3/FBXO9 C-terminal domain-containing protein n=1 Tax=Protopolystoma xenopodis TaxID=117903 RepID=A0A3S5A1W3_9PLAT|nr:unnamed protein product [Protopolystoma xenopodis]